jgi:hypothetical protein
MLNRYTPSTHVWEVDLADLLGENDTVISSSMKKLEDWEKGRREVSQENIVGIAVIGNISPQEEIVKHLERNSFSFEALRALNISLVQVLKGKLEKILASLEKEFGSENARGKFIKYLESNPMDLKIFLTLTY